MNKSGLGVILSSLGLAFLKNKKKGSPTQFFNETWLFNDMNTTLKFKIKLKSHPYVDIEQFKKSMLKTLELLSKIEDAFNEKIKGVNLLKSESVYGRFDFDFPGLEIEEWRLDRHWSRNQSHQGNPNYNLLDFLEQNIVTLPTPSNLPSIRERGYEYEVKFTFEVYLKMKWEGENRAKSHFTDGFLEDIFENDVDQVISFLLCPNFNPLLKEHITLIDLLSFESDYSFDSKWFTVDEFGKKHIYLNAKEFENPLKLRER